MSTGRRHKANNKECTNAISFRQRRTLCTLRRCIECNDRRTQQSVDEQWIQLQQHRPDKNSPLFAALLAFVVLNEVPRDTLYLGAGLILFGLCFSNELIRLGKKAPQPSKA